ncbi:MAG TPA: hypothetical protein VF609_06275, partial [Flavisolibacter sp.]
MKTVIITIIFCFLFCSAQTQISFDTSAHFLAISSGKVLRLTKGVSFVGTGKEGQIKTSIKNNVAILGVSLSDTVSAAQFAGIFFDKIPRLKQGVAIWRYKPWN